MNRINYNFKRIMAKHFIKTEDFTREEYLEACRRAKIFQDGIKNGQSFTNLCSGKVLATLFFQESTRTSTVLQSAIIKLGGGYVGISGSSGTYVGLGEEDLDDFIDSFAVACDIMAIRHKSLDLAAFTSRFPIPLLNAMSGLDEHPIGALALVYTLYRRGVDFKKLKYGIYGMVKSSRPAKSAIKALSIMGATIYEDSVIDEFATPQHVREFVEKTGGKLIRKKFAEFLPEVNLLDILEGLPQPDESPELVKKYNKLFNVFTPKELDCMLPNALVRYIMPRKMTDGRLTTSKEIDNDPRTITRAFLEEWTFAMMGLITVVLGVHVE